MLLFGRNKDARLLLISHISNWLGTATPSEDKMKPKKSWKREVAIVLMLYLMWLGHEKATPELELLAWPFMTFALGAFGLDSYNNQTIPSAYKYSKKELEEK